MSPKDRWKLSVLSIIFSQEFQPYSLQRSRTGNQSLPKQANEQTKESSTYSMASSTGIYLFKVNQKIIKMLEFLLPKKFHQKVLFQYETQEFQAAHQNQT